MLLSAFYVLATTTIIFCGFCLLTPTKTHMIMLSIISFIGYAAAYEYHLLAKEQGDNGNYVFHLLAFLVIIMALASCSKPQDLQRPINKDVIAPTIQMSVPSSMVYASTDTIYITTTDNIGLKSVDLYEDNQLIRRATTTNNPGSTPLVWKFNYPYTMTTVNNYVTLFAVVTDIAGNRTQSLTYTIYKR